MNIRALIQQPFIQSRRPTECPICGAGVTHPGDSVILFKCNQGFTLDDRQADTWRPNSNQCRDAANLCLHLLYEFRDQIS